MPLWRIDKQGEVLVLTYETKQERKNCGQGPLVLRGPLEGWVCDQAAPGDRIIMVDGSLVVRLGMPGAPPIRA